MKHKAIANVLVCLMLATSTGFSAVSITQAQNAESIETAQKNRVLLSGDKLIIGSEVIDISQKAALFFAPNTDCLDELVRVKLLPEAKRPYLIAVYGTKEKTEEYLAEAGLEGVKYYYCGNNCPVETVPTLLCFKEKQRIDYTCSSAAKRLEEEQYPMLLASASLPEVPGAAGNNAIKAMMAFNGAIIKPGEEFLFYKYVGTPSASKGYQMAKSPMETPDGPAWINDIGGGICKAATLLNNAVKQAPDLEITEQHHHTRPVAFAPEGQDIQVGTINSKTTEKDRSRLRLIRIRKT